MRVSGGIILISWGVVFQLQNFGRKSRKRRRKTRAGREREGEGWEGIVRGISLGKLRERAQSLTIGIMKATYSATSDEKDIKNASIGRHTRGVLLKKAERTLTMTRKRTMPLMV